jgi:energy-coupling factor transporter transmembrane protein EcfT
MAQVTFRYIDTHTVFHRTDPRIKLLMLIMISIVAMGRDWWGLLVLFPSAIAVLFIIRVPFGPLMREMKGFLFLFGLIVLVSSVELAPPSSSVPVVISSQGFSAGLAVVARMAFVILIGVFFTSVTRTREMRDAIWWVFQPVPYVNAVRLATMFSLTIRFIPLIFNEAAEIRAALASRGLSGRGRPFRRIRYLGYPLIARAFRRVDAIVNAMESRGYNEGQLNVRLRARAIDALVLAGAGAICAAAIWLDRRL